MNKTFLYVAYTFIINNSKNIILKTSTKNLYKVKSLTKFDEKFVNFKKHSSI